MVTLGGELGGEACIVQETTSIFTNTVRESRVRLALALGV